MTYVSWKLPTFQKSTTISSKIKSEYPWIKVAKFITVYYDRIPWKIKSCVFTSYFNRANDWAKFDCWGGRKTLLYFRLYGLMTWITRLWRYLKATTFGGTDQEVVHFDQLRHWQNNDVNKKHHVKRSFPRHFNVEYKCCVEGSWLTFPRLPANYL